MMFNRMHKWKVYKDMIKTLVYYQLLQQKIFFLSINSLCSISALLQCYVIKSLKPDSQFTWYKTHILQKTIIILSELDMNYPWKLPLVWNSYDITAVDICPATVTKERVNKVFVFCKVRQNFIVYIPVYIYISLWKRKKNVLCASFVFKKVNSGPYPRLS